MSVVKPLKIYIAGAYQAGASNTLHAAPRITQQNVDKAAKAAVELIKLGHIPYVPHFSHYIHLQSAVEIPASYWYEYDNVWLDLCDVVFVINMQRDDGSPAIGVIDEIQRAKKQGKQIYYTIAQIPRVWLGNKHKMLSATHQDIK